MRPGRRTIGTTATTAPRSVGPDLPGRRDSGNRSYRLCTGSSYAVREVPEICLAAPLPFHTVIRATAGKVTGATENALELDFWHRGGAWLRLEVSVLTLEAGHGSYHVRGEERQVRVIFLHRFVVTAAGLQNPIFRAFGLKLGLLEILVRFEVWIVFDHYKQTPECTVELIIRVDLFLRRFRTGHGGAGVRNIREHRGLFLRITLHRLHQVRNQIRAALQIGIDLAPLPGDGFFFHRQLVTRAHELAAAKHKSEDHNNQYDNSGLHRLILLYSGRLYPEGRRRQSPCRSPSCKRPAMPPVRSPSA